MKDWQNRLGESHKSVSELRDLLGLTDDELKKLTDIEERYPVCIPDYYLGLIDPSDRNDPIRKMCVPVALDLSEAAAEDTCDVAYNHIV